MFFNYIQLLNIMKLIKNIYYHSFLSRTKKMDGVNLSYSMGYFCFLEVIIDADLLVKQVYFINMCTKV